jgi:Na+-driven multidrug efflux pump
VRRLLGLGALTGASTALLIALPLCLPVLLRVFTADVAVGGMLVRLLPFAASCAFAYSVASAAEGCLVAARDLRPLAMLYAAWPPLAASVLFALARGPLSLPGALVAWTAFTSVHLARLATFTRRLQQRTAAWCND